VAHVMPTVAAIRRMATRPGLHPAGWLLICLPLVLAGCAGTGTYQYRWNLFFDSVFHPSGQILRGLGLTLGIAVISQIVGVVLGVFGALGRMSNARAIRVLAGFYVWFFRGTPLLVQISFIYFGLGVAGIWSWDRHPLFGVIPGAWQAGVVALGVNEGAYMTEIVRAGILSIDPGQMEAAKSLGMTRAMAMRRIVLPQAARVIVPPLGNEFNNMLKTTSLLVVISVPELYVIFSRLNGNFFAPFEFFLAAAVWYLLLTTAWSLVQSRIEKRFGRGFSGGETGIGLRERIFGSRLPPIQDPSQVSGGR
jgi:polar amino acid transport system permease protein